MFTLNNCVVVDSDEDTTKAIKEILQKHFFAKNVKVFRSGAEAWEHLDGESHTDLLVMEWKLKDLSGSALIQRVRSKNGGYIPVVVASSLVTAEDTPIFNEMLTNGRKSCSYSRF